MLVFYVGGGVINMKIFLTDKMEKGIWQTSIFMCHMQGQLKFGGEMLTILKSSSNFTEKKDIKLVYSGIHKYKYFGKC